MMFIVLWTLLIAAGGTVLSVFNQNYLPLVLAVLGIALSLLLRSIQQMSRQIRRQERLKISTLLVFLLSLILLHTLLGGYILILASLSHSTLAHTRTYSYCLISFISLVIIPFGCLLLYRRRQAQKANTNLSPALAPRENPSKRMLAAKVATLTTLFIIILMLLPRTSGWPPLIFAARKDYQTIAKLLITAGAEVNVVNRLGYSPLIEASYAGHLTMVKLLLDHGASQNLQDGSALLAACRGGRSEIVKILLAWGANPNSFDDVSRCAAIVQASRAGYLEVVRNLIDGGAQVNVTDAEGNTPLMLALGYPEVVRLLLAKGANPHWKNKRGKTALSLAPATKVIEILKASGAKY